MRQFADCKDMLLIQWGDEAGQSRQRQERSPDGRNLSLDLTINGDSGGWLELRRSDTRVLETCQPPAGLDGRKKSLPELDRLPLRSASPSTELKDYNGKEGDKNRAIEFRCKKTLAVRPRRQKYFYTSLGMSESDPCLPEAFGSRIVNHM